MRKQQWEKPQARRMWKQFEFVSWLHPGKAVETPSALGAGSSVDALEGSDHIGFTSSCSIDPELFFSFMKREIVSNSLAFYTRSTSSYTRRT